VRDDHLTRFDVEHPGGEDVTGAGGEFDPGVPAADEALTPLDVDHLAQPILGCAGQPAQRVAVGVDESGAGYHDRVPRSPQRIVRIESQRTLACRHARTVTPWPYCMT